VIPLINGQLWLSGRYRYVEMAKAAEMSQNAKILSDAPWDTVQAYQKPAEVE